jgi:hypothetical protein
MVKTAFVTGFVERVGRLEEEKRALTSGRARDLHGDKRALNSDECSLREERRVPAQGLERGKIVRSHVGEAARRARGIRRGW